MGRSKYIARLMGPVMLIIGIGMIGGMLTEGDAYSSLLKEFIGSRALIFMTGVLALVAGLAIVNAHNLWVRDWRVVVTILGWLFILRGVIESGISRHGADARRPHDRQPCRHPRRRGGHHRARRHPLDHGLRASVEHHAARGTAPNAPPPPPSAAHGRGARRREDARPRFDMGRARSRLTSFRGEPQGRG